MTKKPDLRSCQWNLQFYKIIEGADLVPIDMWVLYNSGGSETVTLGVPPGRDDVAQFVFACIKAGQKLLKEMPIGTTIDEFGPHRAKRDAYRNAVKRHRKVP